MSGFIQYTARYLNAMISIIIPTYNRASLISRAIQSALNQTLQNIEVIVVDDGSTDNTKEAVSKFNDERVIYLKLAKNEGVATARNIGIRNAKGRYIAFLDSDDVWLPEKLEKQTKILESTSPDVGVVYTGTLRIMNNKKYYIPAANIYPKEGNVYHNIICGKYIVPTPAAVVKKECFEKVGLFDENLVALEEWDLWIRISKQYNFKYIDEPLVVSYYSPGSISANRQNFIRALKSIFKKHNVELIRSRKGLISLIYKLIRLKLGHFRYRILGIMRH